MEFEPVIGLEVHTQLKTNTKIFCGCSTAFGAPPNTHVCPVCLGMPGVLPVLNRKVIDFTLKLALATESEIQRYCRFARKNYFYPDLPKGYQISQYELPLARGGRVVIDAESGPKAIGLTRIHLEEDAGKLIHDPHRPVSYVDFNRTGVPLLEIVSEPDIRTPAEAGDYLRRLRQILRYLEISDGNMEEGSFRCDANVSIRPKGAKAFGIRAELKNMNSFRHVERAIAYEIRRQRMIIEEGGAVVQETRLYDAEKDITVSMRGKEEAHDYRYFPDPDLLPVSVDEEMIEAVRKTIPELPRNRRNRYITAFELPPADADILTGDRDLADYFEACLVTHNNPKPIAHWIIGPLLGLLNTAGRPARESPISPARLAELVKLIDADTISGKIAKTVFDEMAETGNSPEVIVEEKGLVQVSDESALAAIVEDVIARHPDEVSAYREGKTKLFGYFVGQIMKATRGKANPKRVNEILKRKLS